MSSNNNVDWLKPIAGIDWTLLNGKTVKVDVRNRTDSDHVDVFLTTFSSELTLGEGKRELGRYLAQTFVGFAKIEEIEEID